LDNSTDNTTEYKEGGHVPAAQDKLTHAVLIASKDGSATIGLTIQSVGTQSKVYVVSDGSTDDTVDVALQHGAEVLDLEVNVGKPAAIYTAMHELELLDKYDVLAILDDDTTLEPDFMEAGLKYFDKPEIAIVCGKTLSAWPDSHRWNLWVASRMFTYWKYQLTIKRGQSAFGAVNCVSGSNSIYRTELLRQIVRRDTPYIVDDCYWAHETQRRKLGTIKYVPEATAYVQDPTDFKAWWKQNTRWLWGTCQAIWGHKVGRSRSWFDFWYVALLFDWAFYIVGAPAMMALMIYNGIGSWPVFIAMYMGGYFLWATAAAVATKKWQLMLMFPLLLLIDWLYRFVFIRAIVKTIKQPTVAECRWESPARYQETSPELVPVIESKEGGG
jgi:biofilm PGA synthesis N-glycosyltransferase PgaC